MTLRKAADSIVCFVCGMVFVVAVMMALVSNGQGHFAFYDDKAHGHRAETGWIVSANKEGFRVLTDEDRTFRHVGYMFDNEDHDED
jgi:hypothetical protein